MMNPSLYIYMGLWEKKSQLKREKERMRERERKSREIEGWVMEESPVAKFAIQEVVAIAASSTDGAKSTPIDADFRLHNPTSSSISYHPIQQN